MLEDSVVTSASTEAIQKSRFCLRSQNNSSNASISAFVIAILPLAVSQFSCRENAELYLCIRL